jgi:vacuole morphology and inheritance protein 14
MCELQVVIIHEGSHVSRPSIHTAANETNSALYHVIQALPLTQATAPSTATTAQPSVTGTVQPPTASPSLQSLAGSPPTTSGFHRRNEQSIPDVPELKTVMSDPLDIANSSIPSRQSSINITTSLSASNVPSMKSKALPIPNASEPTTPATFEFPANAPGRKSRPQSPTASLAATLPPAPQDEDPFDIKETVNVLTLQFLSEHEDTRVAALEWLLMLHQKAPNKVSEPVLVPVPVLTNEDPFER